ncbi:3-deoxy-D-manno-octulosonic acid transferase [Methylocella sp.]|uniref:3-deoxy-D-manno-octulosonic acid transferase n=1 Tax=Methylocella sp. TaxID=1978226 RepID=UPI003784A046
MLPGLYRACSAALAPLGPLYLRLRGWRRAGRRPSAVARRAQERLGRASAARASGRLAWIAAASPADLESLTPLIERLAAAGFHVLATTRDEFRPAPRLPPFALHQYAPLDAPRFCAAFLSWWRPDVALFVGANYPPTLIEETRRRGVPTALVDAAMPARLFRLLRRLPGFAGALLTRFDPCLARSRADADRLRALGAGAARLAGDPVYDRAPGPPTPPRWRGFRRGSGDARPGPPSPPTRPRPSLSSPPIAPSAPGLADALLILVPRRARAPDVLEQARRRGLRAALLDAESDAVERPPQCLVAPAASTGALLRAAPVVFLGGAADAAEGEGALNPVAAAKLGCAILHGPDAGGFEAVYGALGEAGGAVCVDGEAALAAEVALLLHDAAEIREQGRAAAEAVERRSGAAARIMQALSPTLAHVFLRPQVEDESDG